MSRLRRRRRVDAPRRRPTSREALTSIFLEVVVAPGFDAEALRVLAGEANLRVWSTTRARRRRPAPRRPRVDYLGSIRTAGGAVLVSAPDDVIDDPATGHADRRAAADRGAARPRPRLALVRGVTSNAIVLVRDGRLVGLGSGQMSRVDAVPPGRREGRARPRAGGARAPSRASDAFFPFPDGLEALLAAGVTAIVQPGGSVRDAEVARRRGRRRRAMLITGRRHFRH